MGFSQCFAEYSRDFFLSLRRDGGDTKRWIKSGVTALDAWVPIAQPNITFLQCRTSDGNLLLVSPAMDLIIQIFFL